MGIVVQVADQAQSGPGVLAHHPGYPLPHLSRAHDQHPPGAVRPAIQHLEQEAGQDPPRQQHGQIQDSEGDKQDAGYIAITQIQKPGKDQPGKDRCHKDVLELVHRLVGAPGVIDRQSQEDAQPDEASSQIQGPGYERARR